MNFIIESNSFLLFFSVWSEFLRFNDLIDLNKNLNFVLLPKNIYEINSNE